MFVSRVEGRQVFISCHRPIAASIDAYRVCRDANAWEEPRIRLDRWLHGANKIHAVTLIRQYSRLNLADAKHAVDHCLASSKVLVNTKDVASAKQLVRELAKIGFIGTVTYRRLNSGSTHLTGRFPAMSVKSGRTQPDPSGSFITTDPTSAAVWRADIRERTLNRLASVELRTALETQPSLHTRPTGEAIA